MSTILNSKSELIEMFPVSHTREYSSVDPTDVIPELHNGRLLTEKNLISIFSNLSEDQKSFVVYADKSENPDIIKFIIGGYFVNLTVSGNTLLPSGSANLYARISLNTAGYLPVEDAISNSKMAWMLEKGVKFQTNDFEPAEGEFKLHLLTKNVSGNYIIPESSWYRFSTKTIQNIDGGIV